MIIGNGQLAKIFQDSNYDEVCIFASGVSNSNCKNINDFNREKKLLTEALKNNTEKKFVYFSSCALSAKGYPKNDYYQHKENMEGIIKKFSKNYYIFRIPQLFGEFKSHNTLINFIYESILKNRKFKVYDKAYRYVIEIYDVKLLVEGYLKYSDSCIIIDIANPYRYKVLDIVYIIEKLLNKKANFDLIDRKDGYILDTSKVKHFTKKNCINVHFSEDYLYKKLNDLSQ